MAPRRPHPSLCRSSRHTSKPWGISERLSAGRPVPADRPHRGRRHGRGLARRGRPAQQISRGQAAAHRAGRLSPGATLDIVSQAARALDAAHQAGIVHRDIKPGNLLVAAGGTTKITDFGIATAVAAAQASHLTETGMVMGTAMYVSPEQATGAQVTEASDIYSLGVVAYECLAGHPPFTASEPLAIAFAHKHEPVPALPPDVPPPVSDLVYDMLAKTPTERPPSVRVVADRADMLRDALAIGGSAEPGYPGATRADLPAAATGVLPGAGDPGTAPARGPRGRGGPRRSRRR